MAIQIRRGTNTEWENNNSNIVVGEPAIATDAERFFVGTASGDYAEFANLDIIAPAYDTSTSYVVGDVVNRQGKLYSCNTPCSGAFNVSYFDEKPLAEILKDLENEIDYAQYEIGYASGELIAINNGASEIPVKDLTLDIKAVQDLNGYDHPWVGGAGKNILKVTNFTVGESKTAKGVTCTYNEDGSFTLNGTSTQDNAFWNLDYVEGSQNVQTGVGLKLVIETISESVYLQVSVTSTGLKAGVNALTSPVTFTLSSSEASTWARLQVPKRGMVLNNVKVYPMIMLATETDTAYVPYENICPISGWDEANVVVSPTTDAEDGTTYTIQFKDGDNPLTVYGGTLDVTTGVLTVTHTYVELNIYTWTKNWSSGNPTGVFYTQVIATAKASGDLICDSYKVVSNINPNALDNGCITMFSNARIYIKNTDYTDGTTLKSSLSGKYIVYELATPQVVQLTPTQVRTVLGTNNIWNNTNSNNELAYRISNALN